MIDFLKTHRRITCTTATILCGLLFMLLCFSQIQRSLSYAESYNVYYVKISSFADIWRNFSVNGQSPLYYSLLKICAHFFGYTDFSLRMLSVFSGAVVILYLSRLLLAKKGAAAAIAASVLFIATPAMVVGATEAQPWIVSLALSVISLCLLESALISKKALHTIIYLIFVLVGLLSGPTFVFFALLQLCYAAARRDKTIVVVLSVLVSSWIALLISSSDSATVRLDIVKNLIVLATFFASIIIAKNLPRNKFAFMAFIMLLVAEIVPNAMILNNRGESPSKELYDVVYSFSSDGKTPIICASEQDYYGMNAYNSLDLKIEQSAQADIAEMLYVAPVSDVKEHADFRLNNWKEKEYSVVNLGSSRSSYAIVRMSKK